MDAGEYVECETEVPNGGVRRTETRGRRAVGHQMPEECPETGYEEEYEEDYESARKLSRGKHYTRYYGYDYDY